MASLHSALKALSPIDFAEVPQAQEELDPYLADLFTQVQSVVESIPIPDPDASALHWSGQPINHNASRAAEMTVSAARSPAPAPEHAALQKEWGKPMKLGSKENPMNIAVYRLGAKDGKGAWFARRSVHEGLGFSRFKRGFEREFPTSMAVQGAPGEGNIRGIGAETRVEEITVPNRGKLEVYRLSAQFPGPTTPRDFVTLLITSSKAMKPHTGADKDIAPRHYMIVSKPCNHPETQPQTGFIRGQYESVEFIREIPRRLKTSTSSTDLTNLAHAHRPVSPALDGQGLAPRFDHSDIQGNRQPHQDQDPRHLRVTTDHSVREPSPASRRRSATVGILASPNKSTDESAFYDPEENPVEWIMVTRSDPGGSVPRFLVERGTPSSICADAVKFLDWACQREDDPGDTPASSRPGGGRRESFARWEANGTLAGIKEHEGGLDDAIDSQPSTPVGNGQPVTVLTSNLSGDSQNSSSPSSQFMSAVAGTIGAYTPQVVKDHLGGGAATPRAAPADASEAFPRLDEEDEDDAASTISSISWASAESNLQSDENPSLSSRSVNDQTDSQILTQHDKQLAKINEQKAALDAKLAAQREKISKQASTENAKDREAAKRAQEKHDREMKKLEEKHQKEVARIEAKKAKEAKKLADKKSKQDDKDEKLRLTRQRDEARAELELLKKETEIYRKQIGELQKENTTLMARIGKMELESPSPAPARLRNFTLGSESRSRSSSFLGLRKKERSGTETESSSTSGGRDGVTEQ